MKVLVTGGAGFIGAAFIRHMTKSSAEEIVNVDKLTYAGRWPFSLSSDSSRYALERLDICSGAGVAEVLTRYQPDAVIHLAAETHVDRSIDGPIAFIQSNIVGTYTLLEAARHYWTSLDDSRKGDFRFLHVSTDEVYGDLADSEQRFTETTAYAPSSPYAASKASSDHLVRAWHRTYGLPVIITNCSNNYGPYQFPEKLIPLMILNAVEGRPLPVYGDGNHVRDWLYVEDHVRALYQVLCEGRIGETYNIGGGNERRNIDVVCGICDLLDEMHPQSRPVGMDGRRMPHRALITNVPDRPGHDRRYAIDASKIQRELGWVPQETFDSGLRRTVAWYLNNLEWCHAMQEGIYQRERLGLIK